MLRRSKMRKLIRILKKRKLEGLKIIAVKFTDPLLGITDYRFVNGLWDDSLIDMRRIIKRK